MYNSFGLVDGEASNLYFVASRYLLPASLVLLCLSIDLKGLEPGTEGHHHVFRGDHWHHHRGAAGPVGGELHRACSSGRRCADPLARLSTVAGSWIGGGANQAALKEISMTTDDQFSAMLIVDVFVANLWMPFLLVGAGMSAALDRRLKADASAVDELKKKVEAFQLGIARVPSFTDLMIIGGVAFGSVALAHVSADVLGPTFKGWFGGILERNPDSFVQFLSSLEQGFFWIVVTATAVGIGLSFTGLRNYEGAGASKLGSVFLYILVATIGMKMDVVELYHNWDVYWSVILIGLIWMLTHIVVLLSVAKIIKAPFFFVAVGSQANVGGAASAPIVASAFSPALAPVGVLLAVLGYAVGTVGAIVCMELMHAISM